MARFAALLLLLAALAGCGSTTVRQEPSLTVTGGDPGRTGVAAPTGEDAPRISVVTHGQASSPFWAIVRTGVEAAQRQMNVQVDYEAPDVYSLQRMVALVDDAVASKPDGLVVSFPEPGLAPAIRRAVKAGIPVITINSGSDEFRSLGVLAHVGQPEGRAGLAAGRRLARAGVRRALCVNQQVGNIGLDARGAAASRSAPSTSDPTRFTRSRRARCSSPSTSSHTSRATSRWSCSPTAPATGCCRPRAKWSRRAPTSSPARTPPRRSSSASDPFGDCVWRVACHTPVVSPNGNGAGAAALAGAA